MLNLSLAVVGVAHPNQKGPPRSFGIALCRPGDPIELRPEPNNPADEWAVAVYDERGIQIGYLTSQRAPFISKQMSMGREVAAIFQAKELWGATIRVAFDGERPVLPSLRERSEIERDGADEDTGFWPDEEWPDE